MEDADIPEGIDRVLARIPERFGPAVSCGPGWYEIIVNLDRDITELVGDYTIVCVKEKLGTLRYQCWWEPEGEGEGHDGRAQAQQATLDAQIGALISEAQALSARTCETCGSHDAVLRDRGSWLRTLCPGCAAEQGYETKPASETRPTVATGLNSWEGPRSIPILKGLTRPAGLTAPT